MIRLCRRGHPIDSANTYVSPRGKRCCRTCRSNSVAKRRVGPDPDGRTELAMSQEEIAERLGVTRSYVGQVERRALLKMRSEARRLGIRFEELFS